MSVAADETCRCLRMIRLDWFGGTAWGEGTARSEVARLAPQSRHLRLGWYFSYFSYYEDYPMTTRSPAPRLPRRASRRVTSTEAKNRFGQVFDDVLEGTVVIITKHATPKAVLLSYDEYQALTRAPTATLDELRAAFDGMLARMQTPRARTGLRSAFRASPKQLGKAAVAAARRRD